MSWIGQTFSDGDKPSLSRQIAFGLIVIYVVLEIHGPKPTDRLVDLIQAVCAWAFGSGAVSKVKDVVTAIKAKIPASVSDV